LTDSRVVVAGHVCLDIIPAIEGPRDRPIPLFAGGALTRVGPAAFSTGGAVANTGLALHRLGVPVALTGKIGQDRFGEVMLDLLARADPSLTDGMIVSDADHTSYSIVIDPPARDRCFLHHPGANDAFGAEDVTSDRLEGADCLHFGYPPVMRRMMANEGEDLVALYRRAKAAGLTTSLDLCAVDANAPAGAVDWPAVLARVLPHVDLFLPSVDELGFMLRPPPVGNRPEGEPDSLDPALLDALSTRALAWGAAVVGLKLGEHGVYLRTTGDPARLEAMGRALPGDPGAWRGREILAPCFEVDVRGTTGTGDCAVAGLLASLLRGHPPERAVTVAAAAGAASAEHPDAVSGIPPWPDLLERIQSGWSRRPVRMDLDGWRLVPSTGHWSGPNDGRS